MPLSLVQLDALLLKPANPDLEESSNRPPVWRHTTVKVRPVITVTYQRQGSNPLVCQHRFGCQGQKDLG